MEVKQEERKDDEKSGLSLSIEAKFLDVVLFLIATFIVHLKLAGIVIKEGMLFSSDLVSSNYVDIVFSSDIGFSNLTSVILTANMPFTSIMLIPVSIITTLMIYIAFALIIKLIFSKKNKEG